MRRAYCAAFLVASMLSAAGCSRSGEPAARKFIASGDAYLQKGQTNEALIQLRNAVKAKPDLPDAHLKLAQAYEAAGDAVKAYGSYARAATLDPANVDAQLKAGALVLTGGDYERARMHGERAVATDASRVEAHLLLGHALAGLKQTRRAVEEMEQAIALDPDSAPAWTALGGARMARGDQQRADEAFRKAVALAPRSPEPHLALAQFQWLTRDVAGAEATLKTATALDPKHPLVHRALALLYLTTRREREAEPHLRALATTERGQLALSDYYVALGRTADALPILNTIAASTDARVALDARLRLAQIEHASGRRQDAHARLDALLAAQPDVAAIRLVKARLLLAEGTRAAEAQTHADRALTLEPDSITARYLVGVAALAQGKTDRAEEAFRAVLAANPRAAAAELQLARVQLVKGDATGALASAQKVAGRQPENLDAALIVARSLRMQGDLVRAEREVDKALAAAPRAVPFHVERGHLALQRQQTALAREALDTASRLAPGDPSVEILAAALEIASGRHSEAERILRRVVTADPTQLEAFELLGRLHLAAGRLDAALEEYRALSARTSLVGPATMVGMIHESRGERDKARVQYEAILAVHPRAAVAANNLAWIYAETGRIDDAIRLATLARDEMRDRPEAEDTLGWALLKKGLVREAIVAFQRALARAPGNPTYIDHLRQARARLDAEAVAGR